MGTLNWLWKKSEIVDLFNKTKESQTLLKVYKLLPKYSTRQMRKNVINKVRCRFFLFYIQLKFLNKNKIMINFYLFIILVFTIYTSIPCHIMYIISRPHWRHGK